LNDLTVSLIDYLTKHEAKPVSRRGRFGKYGDLKRKSRLRAARLAKRKRFGVNAYLPGGVKRAAKRRLLQGEKSGKGE